MSLDKYLCLEHRESTEASSSGVQWASVNWVGPGPGPGSLAQSKRQTIWLLPASERWAKRGKAGSEKGGQRERRVGMGTGPPACRCGQSRPSTTVRPR